MKGHLILLVGTPSARKSSFASQFLSHTPNLELHEEWLCDITAQAARKRLDAGVNLLFTTTLVGLERVKLAAFAEYQIWQLNLEVLNEHFEYIFEGAPK